MSEACKNCDRVDCPTLVTDLEQCEYARTSCRHEQGYQYICPTCQRATTAEADCHAHTHDWRNEALQLRELVERIRAWVVDAEADEYLPHEAREVAGEIRHLLRAEEPTDVERTHTT